MNTKEIFDAKVDNNWRLLGLSVIEQAMEDYEKAITKLKFSELTGIEILTSEKGWVRRTISECEEFFLGDWILILSDIPGKDYMNKAYQRGLKKAERKYNSYCKKHNQERSAA